MQWGNTTYNRTARGKSQQPHKTYSTTSISLNHVNDCDTIWCHWITVLLLLITVACTVCYVRNRKIITATRGMPSSVSTPYMYDTSYTFLYIILVIANRAKYHAGQSLNVYDDQPAKSNNSTFTMDTPVVKGKLYT